MTPPSLPQSDAGLVRVVGEERASWTPDWAAFRAFVAARPAALQTHLGDLHLAFCAGNLLEPAVVALAEGLRRLALSTRRARVSEDTLDEARQILLERLVIGKGGADPKIRSYEGQGPLEGWLRVALAREALYLHKRTRGNEHESEDLLALEDTADNPELRYLKAHYRDTFRTAFESACKELAPKERSLLRQHLVLGISIDRLCTVYGVHRATVARWIEAAKLDLMRRTRSALESELRMPHGEIERIAQLIQSRLDFSLHRVLLTRSRAAS